MQIRSLPYKIFTLSWDLPVIFFSVGSGPGSGPGSSPTFDTDLADPDPQYRTQGYSAVPPHLVPCIAAGWPPAPPRLQLGQQLLQPGELGDILQADREPAHQPGRDHRALRQGAVAAAAPRGQDSRCGRDWENLQKKIAVYCSVSNPDSGIF